MRSGSYRRRRRTNKKATAPISAKMHAAPTTARTAEADKTAGLACGSSTTWTVALPRYSPPPPSVTLMDRETTSARSGTQYSVFLDESLLHQDGTPDIWMV